MILVAAVTVLLLRSAAGRIDKGVGWFSTVGDPKIAFRVGRRIAGAETLADRRDTGWSADAKEKVER